MELFGKQTETTAKKVTAKKVVPKKVAPKTAAPKKEAPKTTPVSDSIKVGTHVTWPGEKDHSRVATVTKVFEVNGVKWVEIDCSWKTGNNQQSLPCSALKTADCPACGGSGRNL